MIEMQDDDIALHIIVRRTNKGFGYDLQIIKCTDNQIEHLVILNLLKKTYEQTLDNYAN